MFKHTAVEITIPAATTKEALKCEGGHENVLNALKRRGFFIDIIRTLSYGLQQS